MKFGIGKSREFIVGDKTVRAMPTEMVKDNGVTKLFIRELLPPHNSYWYNPKMKSKIT